MVPIRITNKWYRYKPCYSKKKKMSHKRILNTETNLRVSTVSSMFVLRFMDYLLLECECEKRRLRSECAVGSLSWVFVIRIYHRSCRCPADMFSWRSQWGNRLRSRKHVGITSSYKSEVWFEILKTVNQHIEMRKQEYKKTSYCQKETKCLNEIYKESTKVGICSQGCSAPGL